MTRDDFMHPSDRSVPPGGWCAQPQVADNVRSTEQGAVVTPLGQGAWPPAPCQGVPMLGSGEGLAATRIARTTTGAVIVDGRVGANLCGAVSRPGDRGAPFGVVEEGRGSTGQGAG